MDKRVFSATQQMIAKHFYALLSSMTEQQRQGAVLTLTTLNVLAEDGYLSLNQKALEVDFFAHCYDSLVGSALCLKMLSDDGVISEATEAVKNFDPDPYLREADLAVNRIDSLMRAIARNPDTAQ